MLCFKTKYTFLLAAFSALFLSACGDSSNPNPNEVTVEEPVAPPKDTIHRIKLSFVGDIMGHGAQIKSAYDPDTDSYNYEPCFRYIKPIVESVDLAFGNLEVTLNNRGKYSGYPRFRSPDALAVALKEAGFDVLVTANNHSNDDGLQGVIHTIDTISDLGFLHTGTFRDSAERAATYPLLIEKEVDGTTFRIALLNNTYGTNGLPTKAPSVVNLIDTVAMLADIEKAKSYKPDMIIGFMHWGSEYRLDERQPQIDITNFLWRNGVNVVIGAHPHVIEPIKTDTIDNVECIVAYSLGNFISNQFQKNTDIGLIFELELVKNSASGETIIGEHHYIPAWRYIYNRDKAVNKRLHIAVPASAFEQDSTNFLKMSSSDQKKMTTALNDMREHLGEWQSSERVITFDEIVDKNTLAPSKGEE